MKFWEWAVQMSTSQVSLPDLQYLTQICNFVYMYMLSPLCLDSSNQGVGSYGEHDAYAPQQMFRLSSESSDDATSPMASPTLFSAAKMSSTELPMSAPAASSASSSGYSSAAQKMMVWFFKCVTLNMFRVNYQTFRANYQNVSCWKGRNLLVFK